MERTAALLALLLLTACAGGDQPVLRYDELLPPPETMTAATAAAPAETPPGPPDRTATPCVDRTRWAWNLGDGHRLRLGRDLGQDPRLVVVYCRPGDGRGTLRLRAARGGDGKDRSGEHDHRVEMEQTLAGPPGWQRWEVDLAPLVGGSARVTLEVELPPGSRVAVSDAYVRHRPARAAGWSGPEVWVEADDGWQALREPAEPRTAGAAQRSAPASRDGGDLAGRQLLLVSIDTLRWDALVAEVEGAPLMPHVATLAAEGEVFDPHYAGGSWTKPSHATLLTGHPLSVHGADGNETALDPAIPTLAEGLGEAGLATAAMVHDCVWLNPKFGFDRGFHRYRSIKGGTAPAARAAVNWIAAHRDRPFFFFLHTFDAHSDFHRLPYESDAASAASVEDVFGVPGYGCREGECASGLLAAIQRGDVAPLPGEDRILRHLYAAGLQELDQELGRLFRDLRELGVWDDLTLVFTSDHGEMLLEHGATLHGLTWEPVLRVPLVVKWPRGERAGRRTTIPTGAVDVAPTLLALAGGDGGGLFGADLRRPRRDRPRFAGSHHWWVVVDDGWKGVFHQNGHRSLYHLAEDPGEQRDLAAERPDRLVRLGVRLDEMLAWSEATRERLSASEPWAEREAEGGLTGEERDRLRALGYLQ